MRVCARRPNIPVMDSSERQREYVLRTVEERGVRMVRLWFTDVLGQLKSFAISPVELEGAFEEGMRFDGSSIDGFSRVQESDVLARPDPNSFEILPWADGVGTSARVFCDIVNLDGTAFEGDPRQVLRRNLDKAREKGFSFYAAPEMEFFYFGDGDPSRAAAGRSTRPPTSTSRRRTSPPTCASARSTRSRRWASRSSTATTRTPPASTRSTCATPTP